MSRRNKKNTVIFKQPAAAVMTKEAIAATIAREEAKAQARCDPANVHTHEQQPVVQIDEFAHLLAMEPPLAKTNQGEQAFVMASYCREARSMLERVILLLESIDENTGTSMARLTPLEETALRDRRAQWLEHLRGYFYVLAPPPPASGGKTARYSLALQLWLLIAHANVILQQSDAVGNLFNFYPPASQYMSRNNLIVENAPVMKYPLRTVVEALELFVKSIDTIDRFHADFTKYLVALEHRVSELVCHSGRKTEYNAPEWCVPKEGRPGFENVTEEFMIYAMCWIVNLYNAAEAWCALTHVAIYDSVLNTTTQLPIRVPAHIVAEADWNVSTRSMRRLTAFVCETASKHNTGTHSVALRKFLLQFTLSPAALDIYRVLHKTNQAHVLSVLQYEFVGASQIARAYMRRVHFDRTWHSVINELLQWKEGDALTTQSASLDREGFMRDLTVLFVMEQFIASTYRFSIRERFWLFHRDTRFMTALADARSGQYPVIVQQGNRWSVLVPHRRDPKLDVDAVLHWRAIARARRKGLPEPAVLAQPADASGDDGATPQHCRVYDCLSSMHAFAVWSLWLLQLCNGKTQDGNLRDFLLTLYSWK